MQNTSMHSRNKKLKMFPTLSLFSHKDRWIDSRSLAKMNKCRLFWLELLLLLFSYSLCLQPAHTETHTQTHIHTQRFCGRFVQKFITFSLRERETAQRLFTSFRTLFVPLVRQQFCNNFAANSLPLLLLLLLYLQLPLLLLLLLCYLLKFSQRDNKKCSRVLFFLLVFLLCYSRCCCLVSPSFLF